MSLFDKTLVKEVPLENKFRLTGLRYNDMTVLERPLNLEEEMSLNRSGDPLYSFFDINWSFPWFRIFDYELWSFDHDKITSEEWRYISQYSYGSNGFNCSWNGERLNVMSEHLIKPQYQYLYMYHVPFFERLFDQGMKRGKIDEILTFDNAVKQFNSLAINLPEIHQVKLVGKEYWESVIRIMIDGIKRSINDKYLVDIQYSIREHGRDNVRGTLKFTFLAKDQKPMYWYFFDKGLVKNMNFHICDVSNIHPTFNISFVMESR